MPTLRFYYDIVCPFAYMASTQVEALAAEAGVTLEWCPILLGGVLRAVGRPDVPANEMPPSKARLNYLDAIRQADMAGVPFTWHPQHPVRTVNAMRLILAATEGDRPALSKALYRAYWVEGRDVSDLATLARIGAPFGLDPEAVRADPAIRQDLVDRTRAAVEAGVFGVPTFEVGGVLQWGAARTPLVRASLGLPRPTPPGPTGGTIAFFHDFASPYSYLADARIDAWAAGLGATVVRKPFLLGALFHAIGTPMVPLHSFPQVRQDWLREDQQHWSRYLDVPLHWPSTFPLRTVTALRVALVEPATTTAIYRAAWVDDQDIGDAEVLARVLDTAGFASGPLLDATRDPAVKQRLKDATREAVEAGVCGAPTFLVNGQLFWGQDRLDQVAAALGGWSV